uniref:Lipoprotein n=1 Tax=Setaria viridis TaxID=4556 RepID=A0A4U6WH67_SETVI|nr:hypothetical protein SEVIR_1G327132v2 [Setaria viridis]
MSQSIQVSFFLFFSFLFLPVTSQGCSPVFPAISMKHAQDSASFF